MTKDYHVLFFISILTIISAIPISLFWFLNVETSFIKTIVRISKSDFYQYKCRETYSDPNKGVFTLGGRKEKATEIKLL